MRTIALLLEFVKNFFCFSGLPYATNNFVAFISETCYSKAFMEELILCVYCKIEKPSTEFPAVRLEKSGRIAPCKYCRRIERRITFYRMSLFDFYRLWNEQDGKCPICTAPLTGIKFVIDHCHVNGHVRGILCVKCNLLLGYMGDDIERCEKAIVYLKRHKNPPRGKRRSKLRVKGVFEEQAGNLKSFNVRDLLSR